MDACQHQWMDGIDGRINGCMCLRICTCIHECVVWTCNTHESLVREWRVTESARERERVRERERDRESERERQREREGERERYI